MDTEPLTTLEQALIDLPDEVGDFLFGEGMETFKQSLAPFIPDTEARDRFVTTLLLCLLGDEPFETLNAQLSSLPLTDEQKNLVRRTIQKEIFDELTLLLEVHEELEGGSAAAAPDERAPKPSAPPLAQTALQSLKGKLTSASAVMPVAREHTDAIHDTVKEAPVSKSIRAIDPYRELPQ